MINNKEQQEQIIEELNNKLSETEDKLEYEKREKRLRTIFGIESTLFINPLYSKLFIYFYNKFSDVVGLDSVSGGEKWFLNLLVILIVLYLSFNIGTRLICYQYYGKETVVEIMKPLTSETIGCINSLLPEITAIYETKVSLSEDTKFLSSAFPVAGYISGAFDIYKMLTPLTSLLSYIEPLGQIVSEKIGIPSLSSSKDVSKELVVYKPNDLINDFDDITRSLNTSLIAMFGEKFSGDSLLENIFETSVDIKDKIIDPTKILTNSIDYLNEIEKDNDSFINKKIKASQEAITNLGSINNIDEYTIENINRKIKNCGDNLLGGVKSKLSTTKTKIINNSIISIATSNSLTCIVLVLMVLLYFVIMFIKMRKRKR